MTVRETTIEAGGLTFGALEAGEGPLALCLHGFPDTAWTWRHLLPRLASAGYHAVAPFLRGYAPTSVPTDGAYQSGALASDAIALHDVLGGDSEAVLIGHDWGAIAAYCAAAHEPDRWRSLVAMAVPPPAGMLGTFFSYPQLKKSFYVFLFQTAFAEMSLGHNDLAMIDGLWSDWSPGYDAGEDVARVKVALRDPANLAAAIGYYRAMLDPSHLVPAYAAIQESALKTPPQPTLYLHGTTDGGLGVELVADAATHLSSGSKVVVREGVGHFLHLEDPEGVNSLILDWLTT